MNFEYSISRTTPKSWAGCEPPTEDERRAEWLYRYYAAGHHHREPTDDHQEELTP
jgi:hypothetical protein